MFVVERVIETTYEPQRPLAVLAILKGESAQNLLNPNLRHGFPAIVAFLAQPRPPIPFHHFTAHDEFQYKHVHYNQLRGVVLSVDK